MENKALEGLITGDFSQYLASVYANLPKTPEEDLSEMINDFVDNFDFLSEKDKEHKLLNIMSYLTDYLRDCAIN